MNGPFKMKGWSPFTQKENEDLYEGGKYKQNSNRSDIKRNNLLEQIEFIQEDANAKGKPLSDAQKSKIAALQEQISQIPK